MNRKNRRFISVGLTAGLAAFLTIFAFVGANGAGDLGFDSQVDYSVDLANSNSYKNTTAQILPSSGAYSVEAWVYDNEVNTSRDEYITLVGGTSQFLIHTGSGTQNLFLWGSTSSGGLGYVNAQLPVKQWTHLAVTFSSSGTITFYMNGVATFTSPGLTRATAAVGLSVGADASNTSTTRFNGRVDEVKVWSEDRSSSISSDMHTYGSDGTSTFASGLTSYYDFNEGSGTTAFDRTSGGKHLTFSGTGTPNYLDVKENGITSGGNANTILKFPRSYLTSTGGWKVPQDVSKIDALVIAGGGSGGSIADASGIVGGGGGAGGMTESTAIAVTPGNTIAVSVGQGGLAPASTSGTTSTAGTNGQPSSLGSLLTAAGGGAGGVVDATGSNGGSGGGGGVRAANSSSAALAGGSATDSAKGSSGGTGCAGTGSNTHFGAGGGGGAGGAGGNADCSTTPTGGAAGAGKASSITGSAVTYAGGGAGGGSTTNGAPSTLTSAQTPAGTAGAANTGSGGGGAYARTGTATAAGVGGSGVVIISYAAPIDYAVSLNGTSQYLTAPITDSTTSGLYSFSQDRSSTVEFWAKPSSVACANSCTVVGKDGVFKIQIKNGTWVVASSKGTWEYFDTKAPATTNRWQHIAIFKNASSTQFSFAIDGKTIITSLNLRAGTGAAPTDAINPLVVGKSPDLTSQTEFFAGKIDQLKIYSTTDAGWGVNYPTNVLDSMKQLVGYGTSGTTYTALVSAYDFNGATAGSVASHAAGGIQLIGVNLTSSSFIPVATSASSSGMNTVTFDRTYLSAANGWTVPAGVSKISALIVGGGGGGGANTGSGGSGGSTAFVNPTTVSAGNALAVIVGRGGAGGFTSGTAVGGTTVALGTADANRDGVNGGDSILYINGSKIVTGTGGTGGQTYYSSNQCTGGTTQASSVNSVVGISTATSTTVDSAIFAHTGTGGAATTTSGGTSTAGGNGLAFNITGTDSYYGGGGAGGGYNSATAATGGSGGGGNGGSTGSTAGSNGTLGTGGGGGGGDWGCANGGSGDNGVVVIAYGKLLQLNGKISKAISGQAFPTPFVASTVDGGSATISTAGYGANTGLTLTGTTASSTTTTSAVFRDLTFTASSGTFGTVFSAPGYASLYQTTTIGQLPTSLTLGNTNATSNGAISGGIYIAASAAASYLGSADLETALALGDVRLETTTGNLTCVNTSANTVTSSSGSLSLISDSAYVTCNITAAQAFSFTKLGSGFLAKAAVNVSLNSSISTNQGNVTFWSDSDSTSGGAVNYQAGTVTTKGGSIKVGGGSSPATGFATGISSAGFLLASSAIFDTVTGSSSGGEISIRGKVQDSIGITASSYSAVYLDAGAKILSGTGNITVSGLIGSTQGVTGTAAAQKNIFGIVVGPGEIRSTSGTITFNGTVDDSSAWRSQNSFASGGTRHPIYFYYSAAGTGTVATDSGNIYFNSNDYDTTSLDTNDGIISFNKNGSGSFVTNISSNSGDVEFNCVQSKEICLGSANTVTVSTAGNTTITGDRMSTFDGTTFGSGITDAAAATAINFNVSGNLAIKPVSDSWTFAQKFGLKVGSSVKKVLIGKSTNTSDVTLNGASSYVATTTEDYAIFGGNLTCTNYAVKTANFSAKLTGNFSCSNTGHNWSKFALTSSASAPTITVPSVFDVAGDKFTPQDRSIAGFGDFTATYGIPAKLAIVTQPSSPLMIGAALTTQPVVSVVDAYGKDPSGINALASNFSGKVVTAASTESTFRSDTATSAIVSNVAKASFSGLEPLTIASGARPVIQFTSPGLAPVSSAALDQLQAATITFSFPDATFPTATTKTFSTNNTGGAVTYSSNSTAVCTVNSSTGVVTLVTSGTCSIKVTVGASGIYGLTTQDASFTVNPGAQNAITWSPSTVAFTAPNTLTLSGATGGIASTTYTYSVTDAGTAVCSITGTTLSASTEGTCTVKATGTKASYETKSSADVTFTVTKASQASISWTPGTTSFNYNATLTLSGASGGSSTASIVYEVVSGGTATGCSISTAVLSSTSAGTCLVKATKAADAKYLVASSANQTFTINKISQTTPLGLPSGLSIDYISSTGVDLSPSVQNYTGGDGTGAYQVSTATAGCSINATTKVLTAGTNNAGTNCVISVTRAADTNYLVSSATTFNVAINKIAHPAISVTSASTGVWGTNISLTSSTVSGDGVVTWSKVSGTNCSVTGTTLNSSGAGACVVKVSVASGTNYLAAESSNFTVTLSKQNQASLTWNLTSNSVPYQGSLTLATSGGSGTGAVTFSASLASACTISGTTLTPSTVGSTCDVTATKAADDNYNAAVTTVQAVAVSKISQTTALNLPSGLSIDYNSSTGLDLSPSTQNYTGGDGTGAYQVSTATAGCSINATTKVLTAGTNNAGTSCVISVTRAADTNYLVSGAATFSVVINKIAHPAFSITSASAGVWGTNITLTSSTIYGVATWSKVSGANCSVTGTTLSSTGAGSCVIKLAVATSTNYLAAESSNFTVTLNKQNQASFTWNLTSTSVPYLGTLALDTSGGSGTGAVVYSVSNGSACAIVGTTLVPSDVGSTCDVTATKVSDSNYNSADTTTQSITVTKISQASVSFSNGTALTYGQTMDLLAVGGSGNGAISYAVTNAGTTGCAISGVRLSVTGAGTCALSASRAASTNYNISNTATLSVVVSKAAQSVSFTSTVPAEPIAGDTYTVTAATTSGLTPVLSVSSGSCTITGAFVTFGAGTCVIQAASTSTNQYLAASSVTQTIAVGQRNQTLNFSVTIASLTTKTYGDPAFIAQATSTEATLSPTFATGSATTNTACAVSSTGVVVVLAVGTCEIQASQAGTADVAAASTIRKSFNVVPDQASAPFITSVSAGHETITAAFVKPTYIGGSAITGYQIVAVAGGTTVVNSACSVNGSGTSESCSVNGLTNGTSYRIKVAAITAAGIGVYSDLSAARVPATNPAAVSAFTAIPNNTVIDLTWQDPVSLGGGTFDSYRIFYKKTSEANYPMTYLTVQSQTPRSYQITGLINGEAYDVKIVTVTTANTQSLVSNTAEVKETPRTVPDAPATIEVIELAGDLVITWSTPVSDGGNAISEYRVTINGSTCLLTNALDTLCTTPAPTAGGTYPIEVKAKNDAGYGTPAIATFTKAGVPSSSGGGGSESAPSAAKAIEVLSLNVKNVASSGGQLVTVTGNNFKDVTTILVGGVKARVIQVSDTVIKFVAPGNLKGNASLEIKSPVASAMVKDAFTYYNGVAKASVRWILGYVQAHTTLKAADKAKLKTGLKAHPEAIAVTCVGYQSYAYNTPKDAQTAIGRAKQACDYLKSINPKLSVKTVIARTNLTGTPSRKLAVQFRAIK